MKSSRGNGLELIPRPLFNSSMPTDEATSSTGTTAPKPQKRNSKSPTKAQPPAAASDPTGPGTMAGAEKKDSAAAGGLSSAQGPEAAGIAAGYHTALMVASATLGSVAALMTSITFSTVVLGLLPHADDMWGLRAVVAVLRLVVIGVNLLRSRPSTAFAILASVSRLLCAVLVEASFVFSQPIFATIAGGPFRPGDATRQLLLRLTRASWLSTEHYASASFGSLVFAVALGLWCLPLRRVPRRLLNGYPRLVVQLLARAGQDVAKTTIFYRGLVAFLEYLTELPMLPALVALPTPLLMSRQEFSLFTWSLPSPLHLWLLITGDFFMTSSVSYNHQPTIGAVGCVLVLAALVSSGIAPTPGFAFYMAAWFAYAACDSLFANVSRGSAYWTLSSMAARLRVAPGGRRMSYADLEVRIWGWRKRIYRPFDTALCFAVAVALVVAMPYETLELVLFCVDCLYQAALFVYYGMSGTLDHGGAVYV